MLTSPHTSSRTSSPPLTMCRIITRTLSWSVRFLPAVGSCSNRSFVFSFGSTSAKVCWKLEELFLLGVILFPSCFLFSTLVWVASSSSCFQLLQSAKRTQIYYFSLSFSGLTFSASSVPCDCISQVVEYPPFTFSSVTGSQIGRDNSSVPEWAERGAKLFRWSLPGVWNRSLWKFFLFSSTPGDGIVTGSVVYVLLLVIGKEASDFISHNFNPSPLLFVASFAATSPGTNTFFLCQKPWSARNGKFMDSRKYMELQCQSSWQKTFLCYEY